MNEEMVAQWRRSLEQSPLGCNLALPNAPLTPPATSGGPTGRSKSPVSPGPQDLQQHPPRSPSNGRSPSPGAEENSNMSRATHSLTNGGDHSHSSDIGSPDRMDPRSPNNKFDELPFAALSTPNPNQLTASIASHFPSMNNPMSALSLPLGPLSLPPLMSTGRIPKSDPMEGKLQDMLRYNMEKFAGQPLDTLGKLLYDIIVRN
jgi:hypothetical protein